MTSANRYPVKVILNASLFLTLFAASCIFSVDVHGAPRREGDTTWIRSRLDSAWKLMQKKDPRTLPLADSLLKASKALAFNPGIADAYRTIAKYHGSTGNRKVAIPYYDSAIAVNEAIDRKLGMTKCYLEVGVLHFLDDKFTLSISFYQKSLSLDSILGRKQQMADALTNLGLAYERLGDYAKALQYYYRCLKIDEELDYKEGIASDYSVIATIHGKMGDFTRACEFYDRAISSAADEVARASSKINYGILLKNHGDFEKAGKMLNEAHATYISDKYDRGITAALHNLGALYQAMGDYPKAISYYNQSIASTKGNDRNVYQANYSGLAETFLKLKQFDRALEYGKKALVLVNEMELMDGQRKINKLVSDIYKAQGNYQQALIYFENYTARKDSIFSTQKVRQVRDLQEKYESEKKEQEIAALTSQRKLQDESLQKKTVIQYSLIAGFVALSLVGFIVFRINRSKQDAKRQLLAEQLRNEHKEAERLKELDHLKSRFFANVAHEFRTPLTLILGPVENLIGESSGPDKQRLLGVKNSASRLTKLVNQLLDLSKLEAGAIKFDFVNEDVISFLKANTMAFQSLADQKKIALVFTCNAEFFQMKFDRDKLEKIFSNLLSNAFKFTDQSGRIAVMAEIGSDNTSRRTLRVTVRDSGAGVPEADLPFVFNRFYQSGTVSRTTLGSGIGLELTKELVEICGGEIGVVNAREGGAEFYFTLPATEGSSIGVVSDTPPAGEYTRMVLDDAHAAPGKLHVVSENGDDKDSILVIEDNAEVKDYITSSLQGDYHVITANEGRTGIQKAIDTVPDLVITDLMMPVTDGMEVCRTLKDDERTSHVPIIMLTAKADMESKIEGLQSGADDYLAKPFHTKELLVRISNLIANRQKLREKFRGQETVDVQVPVKEKMFMSRLRATVELHLAEEEFGVEELSREMAMSRMQLHRKVKALTSIPTGLYIRSIRLEHAKRLLGEGLYNVSEVAYRVGFNSPTYFSTCFSEEYGFPPSELLTAAGQ